MVANIAKQNGIKVLAALAVIGFASAACAADDPAPKPCHVVFCKDDAKRFLVFEPDGSWVSDVRWFELAIKDGASAVKLTSWKGNFKPSKPKVELRTLAQIQAVSTDDFQKTIDDLQTTQQVGVLSKDAAAPGGKPVQITQ